MTLICVPILFEDPAAALADATAARDGGADLVEFRIDACFSGGDDDSAKIESDAIVKLVNESPLPCIVTCRPVLEGGQYDGPDDARSALFERLGAATEPGQRPPRYLDVELLTYTRSENIKQKVNLAVDHPAQGRDLSTSLILSTHDFHTRPADLIRRLDQMNREPACQVAKVAYRLRSLRDNLELLEILAEAEKPTIALGMGPYGLMSRVLAPKFNAFLTFASLRRSSATAPGQPILSELIDLYRFKSIASTTGVYGVIGDPVEHSLSPHVHNAGFEAMGHDGVYLPLPVPAGYEHFKATLLSMIDHAHLDLRGVSVTIPHKENLVRLARDEIEQGDTRWLLDALSQRCGAGNTLIIERDAKGRAAKLHIANTDGPAAATGVEALIGSFKSKAVCVLGVGGTAKALVVTLLDASAKVVVVNRTLEKAELFVQELSRPGTSLDIVEPEELASRKPDAVFNCTPVGMSGGGAPGASPLDVSIVRNLPKTCVVAESVYSPLRTPLLAMAEEAGLRTVDGAAMFVRQAGEQFTLWTKRTAPTQLFDRIVRETLAVRMDSPPEA